MEGVAVSPMVVSNGGTDAIVSDTAIPSVIGVEEADQVQIINGDAATIFTIAADAGTDGEGFNSNAEQTKDDGDNDTTMQCATPVSGRSPSSTHRKRRGAFSLFRAVFQSFGRSDSMKKTDCATSPKKKAVAAAAAIDGRPTTGDSSPSWKSLVDGVRPLRLRGQELEYYPPPPPLGHSADVYHDVLLPPPSPAWSGFSFDFEEVGMTSRYASAQDLHQMDDSGNGEGEGEDATSPHAIDMQAEEFIAKFYQQFKSESFDGRAAASE
ncbi:unnamed protein product [Urochloa decumbens]|uniref:Uncharacterized protein n=1 Tax=Urochloa decumbens TaxID=240449 RepID=A0ABC8ZN19_9POAL